MYNVDFCPILKINVEPPVYFIFFFAELNKYLTSKIKDARTLESFGFYCIKFVIYLHISVRYTRPNVF